MNGGSNNSNIQITPPNNSNYSVKIKMDKLLQIHYYLIYLLLLIQIYLIQRRYWIQILIYGISLII